MLRQVNASDAPWRSLVSAHGATLTHSQMLLAHRLIEEPEYRDYFLEDLRLGALNVSSNTRTFVQLGGNDPVVCAQAARIVEPYSDGIGMCQ